MMRHHGFLPIWKDANGEVGAQVEHPYVVDVRGVGAELTKLPSVQITWSFRDEDGEDRSVTLPALDVEAVAMLSSAVDWAGRYLNDHPAVKGEEE